MSFLSLQFAGYLATGLTAGIIAGMFGVGGGILIVPALLFLFHLDGINPVISMQLAVSTSLATIVFTNVSATWHHHRHNSVHWPLVRHYIPGILLGAWLGAQLAARIDGEQLRALFGLFEILIGLQMISDRKRPEDDTLSQPPALRPFQTNTHIFLAVGIGILSTLFGIGGGTMLVPAITLIAGLSIRQAIGSSAAIGAVLALVGTTGLIQAGWENDALPPNTLGFVVPLAGLAIITGTLITTPLGVKLAHSMEPRLLKKGFGLLLLLVGIKLFMKS